MKGACGGVGVGVGGDEVGVGGSGAGVGGVSRLADGFVSHQMSTAVMTALAIPAIHFPKPNVLFSGMGPPLKTKAWKTEFYID